jgi:MSHA pilin protein MshD
MCISVRRAQAGVSLLELIAAILIVAIALSALISAYVTMVAHSADPMIRRQAQLIAEGYLEEILLKRFVDPDTTNVCPAAEATRSLYDNVCDYSGLSEPPSNLLGTPISALSGYSVLVTVARDATVSLNGLVNNVGAGRYVILRVDVDVTHTASNVKVTLSGYRTNYNCNVATGVGCSPL